MEVLNVHWISGRSTIGIISAKNEIGETHVYIGVASGLDEDSDIKTILDWGTKIKPELFQSIMSQFV